jgi:hypothetical protein
MSASPQAPPLALAQLLGLAARTRLALLAKHSRITPTACRSSEEPAIEGQSSTDEFGPGEHEAANTEVKAEIAAKEAARKDQEVASDEAIFEAQVIADADLEVERDLVYRHS